MISKQQTMRLAELESLIDVNQIDFYALGIALKEIKNEHLYLQYFSSFERYLVEHWDIKRAQAYRLISASQVIDNLSPIGDRLPENELQARELAKLNPTKQIRIWKAFLKSDITLNALNLRQFIANDSPDSTKQQNKNAVHQITNQYKDSALALLEQIRIAQNEQWKFTSKAAALHWINIMRNKILTRRTKIK